MMHAYQHNKEKPYCFHINISNLFLIILFYEEDEYILYIIYYILYILLLLYVFKIKTSEISTFSRLLLLESDVFKIETSEISTFLWMSLK